MTPIAPQTAANAVSLTAKARRIQAVLTGCAPTSALKLAQADLKQLIAEVRPLLMQVNQHVAQAEARERANRRDRLQWEARNQAVRESREIEHELAAGLPVRCETGMGGL